jgi:Putative zinc-finger
MCNKEAIIEYLYGELRPPEREAFDRHLETCDGCRSDVDGLRGTRTTLQAWSPPEPDLGFEIVRSPQHATAPAAPARWWKPSPVWAFAAAAMLIGAISAGLANLEITAGATGVTVRTGWSRADTRQAAAAPADASVDELKARLAKVEAQLTEARQAGPVPAVAAPPNRMSDAEMVRLVRQLIDQSEERQQGVLARQILQVNRDFEVARRTDLDRLGRGMEQIQRTAADTYQRQKALEDLAWRVGLQR